MQKQTKNTHTHTQKKKIIDLYKKINVKKWFTTVYYIITIIFL